MSKLDTFRHDLASVLAHCAAERKQRLKGMTASGEDLKIIVLLERLAEDAERLDIRAYARCRIRGRLVAQRCSAVRDALLAQVGVLVWPKDVTELVDWMSAQTRIGAAEKSAETAPRSVRGKVASAPKPSTAAFWTCAQQFAGGIGILAPMLSVWELHLGVKQFRDHQEARQHPAAMAKVKSVSPIGEGKSAGVGREVMLAYTTPSGTACQVKWHATHPLTPLSAGDDLVIVPRSDTCEVPLVPAEIGDPIQSLFLAAGLMACGMAGLKLWVWLFRHPRDGCELACRRQ